MKNSLLYLCLALTLLSCKNEVKITDKYVVASEQDLTYTSIGKAIDTKVVLTSERMLERYKAMTPGDTTHVKMKASIKEVCSKKGCWMTLDLDGTNEVMVKFKNYGFFMPLDADGEVIVNGKAYVAETSVEDLRHYAEDAGKSKEEIEAITEPKQEYHFEADGVLLED